MNSAIIIIIINIIISIIIIIMTLMMTSAHVVETSVNVTSNSPSRDYTHPDDHNLPNYYYYYYYYYHHYYIYTQLKFIR